MTLTYRQLGPSGLTVSSLGLGGNTFGDRIDGDDVTKVVQTALDLGVTLFDTADIYAGGRSEELLGRALAGRRAEAVVATKFGMDAGGANGPDWGVRGSRRYIRLAVEASLRRLGTDWIDLYQMHEPDPHTPIEETLAALQELVQEGKVRYVGSSNFSGWQVVDADWTARTTGASAFVSAQNPYSLYDRSADAELLPACEQVGVSLIAYYPLASGLLTGKYRRGEPAPEGSRLSIHRLRARLAGADFDRVEALTAYAEDRDLTLLQVALGGLAAQPSVAAVITGVTSPEQVHTNVAAASWEPSADDLLALDDLTRDFGRS